jgi:hypothetical protein
MTGAFPLNEAEIAKQVTNNSPGNYAFGNVDDKNVFHVYYVGCAETDLIGRIRQGIGKYKQFKFSYAASAQEAFEKESQNYHDFNPPDNKIHPAKPAGSGAKCPRCNAWG